MQPEYCFPGSEFKKKKGNGKMTIFTVLAWTLSFRWCFIFYFGGGKFNSYQLMEGV